MRTRYLFRPDHPEANGNGFVSADKVQVVQEGAGFNYIADEMEPTRHMGDGNFYTSKHKFRQATRDAGCIEIGNEVPTMLKPREPLKIDRRELRGHIHKAMRQLQGY